MLSEDIRVNSMTLGKYSIVNPNDNQPIPDYKKSLPGYFTLLILFQQPSNYRIIIFDGMRITLC